MTNEKELRAQAQQQIQTYIQQQMQQQGKELSDEDLEKIAGGESYQELYNMYIEYVLSFHVSLSHSKPLGFLEWMENNGHSLT